MKSNRGNYKASQEADDYIARTERSSTKGPKSYKKPKSRKKRLRKDQKQPELTGSSFTFDEWVAKGYRVLKGQKSRSRGLDGKPLFGADQVWFVPVDKRDKYLAPSKPSGLVREVLERMEKGTSPYIHSKVSSANTHDPNGFITQERVDYHMSQMNPTHRVLEALEDHLDDVFMKHHGHQFEEFPNDEPPW